MNEGSRPCLLPHQKERLELTYGKEKEYYETEKKNLEETGQLTDEIAAELDAKIQKAEENLNEVRLTSICPSPDQEGEEGTEPSQDLPSSE